MCEYSTQIGGFSKACWQARGESFDELGVFYRGYDRYVQAYAPLA
jgi:hypothetical protein